MLALSYAIQILSSLPSLIAAGIDVMNLIKDGNAKLLVMKTENRDPTDQEWADLNAIIADLRSQRPDVTNG